MVPSCHLIFHILLHLILCSYWGEYPIPLNPKTLVIWDLQSCCSWHLSSREQDLQLLRAASAVRGDAGRSSREEEMPPHMLFQHHHHIRPNIINPHHGRSQTTLKIAGEVGRGTRPTKQTKHASACPVGYATYDPQVPKGVI